MGQREHNASDMENGHWIDRDLQSFNTGNCKHSIMRCWYSLRILPGLVIGFSYVLIAGIIHTNPKICVWVVSSCSISVSVPTRGAKKKTHTPGPTSNFPTWSHKTVKIPTSICVMVLLGITVFQVTSRSPNSKLQLAWRAQAAISAPRYKKIKPRLIRTQK